LPMYFIQLRIAPSSIPSVLPTATPTLSSN